MTLKELTIKRGLRAEAILRYIDSSDGLRPEFIKELVRNALDDITEMIKEYEESNIVVDNEMDRD